MVMEKVWISACKDGDLKHGLNFVEKQRIYILRKIKKRRK
jgi:hypothetical protein